MNFSALFAGSILGIAGSLHCVGMCGPLMLLLPGTASWKQALKTQGMYHLGRTFTYATLGAFAGLLFLWVDIRAIEQQFSIALGAAFLGLWIYDYWGRKNSKSSPLEQFIHRSFGKALSKHAVWGWFLGGMLNGLLPCGLVYGALLASLSTASNMGAIWFMTGFGLSTAPALIGLSMSKSLWLKRAIPWLRKALPFWLLLMALLFFLRGANLGIPFLSPHFNSNPSAIEKPSCCS